MKPPRNPHALAAKRAVPHVIPDKRRAKPKRAARKAAAGSEASK